MAPRASETTPPPVPFHHYFNYARMRGGYLCSTRQSSTLYETKLNWRRHPPCVSLLVNKQPLPPASLSMTCAQGAVRTRKPSARERAREIFSFSYVHHTTSSTWVRVRRLCVCVCVCVCACARVCLRPHVFARACVCAQMYIVFRTFIKYMIYVTYVCAHRWTDICIKAVVRMYISHIL